MTETPGRYGSTNIVVRPSAQARYPPTVALPPRAALDRVNALNLEPSRSRMIGVHDPREGGHAGANRANYAQQPTDATQPPHMEVTGDYLCLYCYVPRHQVVAHTGESEEAGLRCLMCGVDEDSVCLRCFLRWTPDYAEMARSNIDETTLPTWINLAAPGQRICTLCVLDDERGLGVRPALTAED